MNRPTRTIRTIELVTRVLPTHNLRRSMTDMPGIANVRARISLNVLTPETPLPSQPRILPTLVRLLVAVPAEPERTRILSAPHAASPISPAPRISRPMRICR